MIRRHFRAAAQAGTVACRHRRRSVEEELHVLAKWRSGRTYRAAKDARRAHRCEKQAVEPRVASGSCPVASVGVHVVSMTKIARQHSRFSDTYSGTALWLIKRSRLGSG